MKGSTLPNEQPQFLYNFEDAVDVIQKNISQSVSIAFSRDDIFLLLELKDEFLDLCCSPDPLVVEVPMEIDQEALIAHMLYHGQLNGLQINREQLIEILDAELVYFEENGLIRDAGEWLN